LVHHSSRVQLLGIRCNRSIGLEMVHKSHSCWIVRSRYSIGRMEMVRIQQSILQLMVHSSKLQLMVRRSNQSMRRCLGCMGYIRGWILHSSSSWHMGMGLIRHGMIQLMARMSRVQLRVHSNSWSIRLGLVHSSYSFGLILTMCSIQQMEMVHSQGSRFQWIVRSSKEGLMAIQSSRSIELEMVRRRSRFGCIHRTCSNHCMGMVLVQLSIVGLMVGMSRVQQLVRSSRQTRKLEMGCTRSSCGLMVRSSSMIGMEMVLKQLNILQCLVHMSRDQQLGLRSSWSRQLGMGNRFHMIQLMVRSSSIQRMGMVRRQLNIHHRLAHKSRVQRMVLRRSQSMKLEWVHMEHSFELILTMNSMRHMEMVHFQRSRFQWMAHSSKDQWLVRRNMMTMQLGLGNIRSRLKWMVHNSSMSSMEMVLKRWSILQ
jgi:hypothetical protein